MSERILIRDASLKIIGKIDVEPNGDKVIRNFYGTILGKYNAARDITYDFYGRIVAHGDASGMLISMDQAK